jgi:hypothetical protein
MFGICRCEINGGSGGDDNFDENNVLLENVAYQTWYGSSRQLDP